MPFFERENVKLYYEEHGDGFPLLLFAPGGLRSAIPTWQKTPFHPVEEFQSDFRVIAMDQRNAGQSVAPVSGADGWDTFTADHLALLDHLEIDRTHVMGGCIGGPYCLGIMKAAPDRIASAVLQQSIGLADNRDLFYDIFQSWSDEIKAGHPEASDDDWSRFRSNMFDGDFDFNVGREFVSQCQTPMLVLMGNDQYHPEEVSREIASIAPNATLIEQWKNPEQDGTVEKVRAFLRSHTPE